MKKHYTEQQIAYALKQAETGVSVPEIVRKMGISEATFYNVNMLYCGFIGLRDSFGDLASKRHVARRGSVMETPTHNTQVLIQKIQSLPTDRIAEVEDFVDFLKQRTQAEKITQHGPLDFPVISVGRWPNDLSLHREDMYGDNGR